MENGPAPIASETVTQKQNGNGGTPPVKRGRGRPRTRPIGEKGTAPGRYNLHVVLCSDEHQLLRKLMEQTKTDVSELVRRLVLGAAVAGGVVAVPALKLPAAPPQKCVSPREVCTPPSIITS